MPRKNQRPKPMTTTERVSVAVFFEKKAEEAERIFNGCMGISHAYPGFIGNATFDQLYRSIHDAQENAKALADYIRVATDEQWQRTPKEQNQ